MLLLLHLKNVTVSVFQPRFLLLLTGKEPSVNMCELEAERNRKAADDSEKEKNVEEDRRRKRKRRRRTLGKLRNVREEQERMFWSSHTAISFQHCVALKKKKKKGNMQMSFLPGF